MRTIIHDQHQRSTRTERGKLVGMCASTLGVAKTGRRFAGLGCSRRSSFRLLLRIYDLLPTGRGLHGSGLFSALSQFDGIGSGLNRSLANLIHNTADHPLHNAVEPFKRHFQNLRFDRSNPIPGAKYAVPHTRVFGTQNDR